MLLFALLVDFLREMLPLGKKIHANSSPLILTIFCHADHVLRSIFLCDIAWGPIYRPRDSRPCNHDHRSKTVE